MKDEKKKLQTEGGGGVAVVVVVVVVVVEQEGEDTFGKQSNNNQAAAAAAATATIIMVERSRSIRKSSGHGSLSNNNNNNSSHHSSAATAKQQHQQQPENNPIKTDAELSILVHQKLEPIEKYNSFQRWKGKFLTRFETFLYQKGMDPAKEEAAVLQATLIKLTKQTSKVLYYIEAGDLSGERKTVKASLALNEMCVTLEDARQALEGLIPSSPREEKQFGYSKFHLGAVLIQDNFPQYVAMKAVERDLETIGKTLEEVMDRQQHDCFGKRVAN